MKKNENNENHRPQSSMNFDGHQKSKISEVFELSYFQEKRKNMKMIIILLIMFVVILLVLLPNVLGDSWSAYVLNATGSGIDAVNVSIYQATGQQDFLNSTLTDINGFFQIFFSAASTFLNSSKDGYATDISQDLPNINDDQTLPFNITLEKALPGKIAGRITNSSGEGIENVSVSAIQGSSTINSTLTNSNGNYSISLIDGTYTVKVNASNYISQNITNVVVQPNVTTTQDFVLNFEITPPVITDVSATLITSSETVIIWQTDEDANLSVSYWVESSSVLSSSSATLMTSHMVRLSSLSSSTLYFYNVSSCDFVGNCNTSTLYNFTTLVSVPSGGDGGGGGGGSGGGIVTWTLTYGEDDKDLSERDFITKALGKKERIRIKVGGEIHHIGIVELNNVNITINVSSVTQQAILAIGEEKRFEITDDEYYDILVKLNNIRDNKASITITYIHEEVLVTRIPAQLFDIRLDLDSFLIEDISELVAIATFENFGTEPTSVTLLFTILNKDGEEVHSEEHAIIVETEKIFKRRFADVDLDLPKGKYTFILTTLYHVTVVDEFRHEFEITKKKVNWFLIIGIFVSILIIGLIGWFIWKSRFKMKKRKNDKMFHFKTIFLQ